MSIVGKKLAEKSTFSGTTIGDLVITHSRDGAIRVIRTKNQSDVVQNVKCITGVVDGVPTYGIFPADGPLPSPPECNVNASDEDIDPWYMEDHDRIQEVVATLGNIQTAKNTLIAKCAGDTEAQAALTYLINTFKI